MFSLMRAFVFFVALYLSNKSLAEALVSISSKQKSLPGLDADEVRNISTNHFGTWWTEKMEELNISGEDSSWPKPLVQISTFGPNKLRGLRYVGADEMLNSIKVGEEGEADQEMTVLAVPRSLCLWSYYPEDRSGVPWDVSLAQQLCNEMRHSIQTGRLSGFCTVLWPGVYNKMPQQTLSSKPPSTAPDALRHWTDAEKSCLATESKEGADLVRREKTQQNSWRILYDKYILHNHLTEKSPSAGAGSIQENVMSWNEFQWSMEAVYSRSFSGVFGCSPSSMKLQKVDRNTKFFIAIAKLVSLPSAVVGILLALLNDGGMHSQINEMLLLVSIGIIASTLTLSADDNERIESLKTTPNQNSTTTSVAVMAPFMDIANHLEGAKSSIEYDSLLDAMTLTIHDSSTCVIEDDVTNTKQLCISYGPKTPDELLLNYGFLPFTEMKQNESSEAPEEDPPQSMSQDQCFGPNVRRRKLASQYLTLLS